MPKIENKTNHEKVIGRDPVCDFVILDPKCRVSRRHVLVKKLDTARFEVTDLNSSNGTHVNGRKIPPNSPVVVSQKDNITLSKDYLLDLGTLWKESRASGPNKNVSSALVTEPESQGEGTIIRVNHGDRNIQLDTNRTTIGELISVDKIGFVTVGRDSKNEIIINDSKVSREHCKLRLVSPYIFEIIDLGSTNGTFVDGIRIESGKNLIFKTQAKISLGDASKFLDLRKVFPEIQDFPQQEKKVPHPPNRSVPKDSKIASPEEMEEFKS